jgi:NADH:ubiquinone oxidoreductase subunit D
LETGLDAGEQYRIPGRLLQRLQRSNQRAEFGGVQIGPQHPETGLMLLRIDSAGDVVHDGSASFTR